MTLKNMKKTLPKYRKIDKIHSPTMKNATLDHVIVK